MIGQGMPILNAQWTMDNGVVDAPSTQLATRNSQLALTGPIPNTAFRIHPGVPRENQRIPVGGYVTDGRAWAELRLVVDGVSLLSATDSVRLDGWWTLEPGQHTFWMEGRVAQDGEIVRSESAFVVVE